MSSLISFNDSLIPINNNINTCYINYLHGTLLWLIIWTRRGYVQQSEVKIFYISKILLMYCSTECHLITRRLCERVISLCGVDSESFLPLPAEKVLNLWWFFFCIYLLMDFPDNMLEMDVYKGVEVSFASCVMLCFQPVQASWLVKG